MTRSIPVRNPRTGAVDHHIEAADAARIGELASALRSSQSAWEDMAVDGRTKVLGAWRQALESRRAQLVDALVVDTGRRTESEMEVDAVARSIDRWCTVASDLLADESRPASMPTITVRQTTRPYALVGAITPWNFPLLLSLIDAVPALVAGCAVIVKPSEVAPRFIGAVRDALADVPDLPLAYVEGDGETGAAVIDAVDLLCFTGSVATGRRVAEQAARRFIPAFLELGGKDPALVLASADLERATSAILWGGTANAGQSCQSIERIYVEGKAFEPFVSRLVSKARSVKLAVPNPTDGHIGPIIASRQIDVIAEHLADAVAKGADARCGGAIETIGGGAYLRPTVLTSVDHSMKVMTEETFGPVLPVMQVTDADDAVHWANDTVYGLSAAVFAGSTEEALAAARGLNAGGISINDAALTAFVHDGEKNSFNLSGLGGSRMGPAALRRFGRRQAFLVADATQPDPWWYQT